MKTTNNKCILATGFPMACFVFILLNISIDSSSIYAADFKAYKTHFWINSTIHTAVDSSITNFHLADNIINNMQTETEKEFELESWMMQSDIFQHADATNSSNHSLNEELDLSYESWMSEPDLFIGQVNADPYSDEVQSEEEISLESWMINTSSWVEVPCDK